MSFSCWISFQNRNSRQARESRPAVQLESSVLVCPPPSEMSGRVSHVPVPATLPCPPPAPVLRAGFAGAPCPVWFGERDDHVERAQNSPHYHRAVPSPGASPRLVCPLALTSQPTRAPGVSLRHRCRFGRAGVGGPPVDHCRPVW